MKNGIAWICGCFASVVFAGPVLTNVSEPLSHSLRSDATKSAVMDAGVLRVILNKPTVSELVFYTFIYHDICAEQWRKPEQFAKAGLKRVEVLDAGGATGFAFDGDAATCAEMGQMGKNFRTFIGQRTTQCEGGRCGQVAKK